MESFGRICFHLMLAIGAVVSFSFAKSFELRGEKLRYLIPRSRVKTDRPIIGEYNLSILQLKQKSVSAWLCLFESGLSVFNIILGRMKVEHVLNHENVKRLRARRLKFMQTNRDNSLTVCLISFFKTDLFFVR